MATSTSSDTKIQCKQLLKLTTSSFESEDEDEDVDPMDDGGNAFSSDEEVLAEMEMQEEQMKSSKKRKRNVIEVNLAKTCVNFIVRN